MIPEVFSTRITVTQDVIDDRNHVNNLAYLQWCMEVASAHWDKNATPQMRGNYVWYVLEHKISYKAAAFLDQELLLETWVAENQGVRSVRNFKITRPEDKKLLVEAATTWCLLDAKRQKPTAITPEIRNLFLKQKGSEGN